MNIITFISSLLTNKRRAKAPAIGRYELKPPEGWWIDAYFGANWDHDTIWYYEKRRWHE